MGFNVRNNPSINTILASGAKAIDPHTGAIAPPIHLSTNFARDDDYELISDYVYSRYGTPNYDNVERLAAKLDNGEDAKLFSSGMAGIVAILETLNSGDHILAPSIMYFVAQEWMRYISKKRGIELTLFDVNDRDAISKNIIKGKTKIVWIETAVNPTWQSIDIEQAAIQAQKAGAILVVDSTIAPPVTTKPIELGADIVFHSATKYYNGHCDVLAGVVVTKETNKRWDEIVRVRELNGSVLGPFEAWLLHRGMKTLGIRYKEISNNALKVAKHFEKYTKVERVFYPGLESNETHDIAKKQMKNGFGGMISLLLRANQNQCRKFASSLEHFTPATSLGGVESLVEHRASVESPESLVPKNLIRFSIGIEDADDLIADLEKALEAL